MEIIIGVFGLLMMAGGVMEGLAGMTPSSAISGSVLFAGGVVTLALGGVAGQVRRLRNEIRSVAEKR